MNVVTLLKAYKNLADAEKKQKALDKMKANPLNYGIIRDLMNSARSGVVITVTFVDGSKMDIKPDTQFEAVNKRYTEAF